MLNLFSRPAYPGLFKALHWIIALFIIGMLCTFFLDDLPESIHGSVIMVHKSLGLTIFALMIIRLTWITIHGKPDLPMTVPRWQRTAAFLSHYALYAAVFLIVLAGWSMATAAGRPPNYFGLFTIPFPGIEVNKALSSTLFQVHKTLALILIGLIFLHTMGALKHHFINRDDVLKRMLP